MNCLSISERPRPLHDVTDIYMYMYASVYEQIQLSTGVRRLVANDGKKTAQSATSFVFECFRLLIQNYFQNPHGKSLKAQI